MQPKPAAVRVTIDGESEELKPGKQSYAKWAETIEALDPDLIQALDDKGNIIRAMKLGASETVRSDAGPELPEGLKADPHALMLTHFANLLHRAYEHSTDVAFTKFAELAEIMSERTESIERRLEAAEVAKRTLEQEAVDAEYERAQEIAEKAGAEGNEGFMQQMAAAFLQGQIGKGAATGAPTNGAAKGKS